MEEWEMDIIKKNLDKLVDKTTCNVQLLTKLFASGILAQRDFDELMNLGSSRPEQSLKFYMIIQTRPGAFQILLEAFKEGRQTAAMDILTNAMKKTRGYDIESVKYDEKNVIGRIGKGTIVYNGKLGDRDVAVKRVNLDVLDVSHVIREIEILKTCDRHENIVRYFGSVNQKDFVLIIQEMSDMSLKKWVQTKSTDILPFEVLKQITMGLEWLHKNGIIHQNMKPENILLIRSIRKVKLSDFGFTGDNTDEMACRWLAPEILAEIDTDEDVVEENQKKMKHTSSSDVFTVGCIYYYVLSDGKHPFGTFISCLGNILTGKSIIHTNMTKNIIHGCTRNTVFIKEMISHDPTWRPSCSSVLLYPMFWSEIDRVKFLEQQTKANISAWSNVTKSIHCGFDHKAEIEALRKIGCEINKNIGCALPFAYLDSEKSKSKVCSTSAKKGEGCADPPEPNGFLPSSDDEEDENLTLNVGTNLPSLIQLTDVSPRVSELLATKGIITDDERKFLESTPDKYERARKLYYVLSSKRKGYSKLLSVLKDEGQIKVVNIMRGNIDF